MEKHKYQPDDSFLRDYLNSLPIKELKLMAEYSHECPDKCINEDNQENWNKSFELHVKLFKVITDNLFDVTDNHGFPKAKVFIDIFLREENYNITIGRIAELYIQRVFNSRSSELFKKS